MKKKIADQALEDRQEGEVIEDHVRIRSLDHPLEDPDTETREDIAIPGVILEALQGVATETAEDRKKQF